MDKQLKIALPKGRLLAETAILLQKAGWGLSGYEEGLPSYRLQSPSLPHLLIKVFHERDIPIQVAVGNYDLGICGLDWVEELLAKYPRLALVRLRALGYGDGALHIVASRSEEMPTLEKIRAQESLIRLASEYPNLAESFALNLRLRRFSVFPLWGAAEVYPPENADLALISGRIGENIFNHNLVSVSRVLDFSAYLIANRTSWESQDLSAILASLDNRLPTKGKPSSSAGAASAAERERSGILAEPRPVEIAEEIVRLALPDGHQQQPTLHLLNQAGIQVDDYPSAVGNRRPATRLVGVTVKVVRPQDMPQQVANGNFDLAITGRDWLIEHLDQFPSSPVTELLDLKYGWVKLVAVVSKDLSATDVSSLKQFCAERLPPIRIASEYVNIADRYARDNHLGLYRVIPTWGASEAFLPEDADLLIENTQTGGTIARHNLKIIDTLFQSTACLIGNKKNAASSSKQERIKSIAGLLRAAVEKQN